MKQLTTLMTIVCVLWPVVALADWTDEGDIEDAKKPKPAKPDCTDGLKLYKSVLPKVKVNKKVTKAVKAYCEPLVKQCTQQGNLVCLSAASHAQLGVTVPTFSKTAKKIKTKDLLLSHLRTLMSISKVQATVWSASLKTGIPAKDLHKGKIVEDGCDACKTNMAMIKKRIKKEKNRARKKMLVDMYLAVEAYQDSIFNAENMSWAKWSAAQTNNAKKTLELHKRLEFE